MNWINISEQVLNLSIDYRTDATDEWNKERVWLPDDLLGRLNTLYTSLGKVVGADLKNRSTIELRLTDEELHGLIRVLHDVPSSPSVCMDDMRFADELAKKIQRAYDSYRCEKG